MACAVTIDRGAVTLPSLRKLIAGAGAGNDSWQVPASRTGRQLSGEGARSNGIIVGV